MINRIFAIFVLFLGLSGCASNGVGGGDVGSLEQYNRAMFEFNNKVDKYVVRPVAKGYRAITNKYIRTRVSNFFDNVGEPISAVNHVLQGEFASSGNNVGRFVINTTLGVVGLFDVASSMGMERKKTGFDETLSTWCVPDGPFVVLPIMGPSTPRAATGFVVDAYSSPLYWVTHESDESEAKSIYYAASGLKYLNLMAENLAFLESLEEGSIDYYEAVKSSYMQNRSKLRRCGIEDEAVAGYDFDMDDMDYE